MKKITLTFIGLIIFVASFSQNNSEEILLTKKQIKKTVSVELTNIQGEVHKGFLWFTDSTKIAISTKNNSADTIIIFEPKFIYKLKFVKKYTYGNKFGKHLLIGTGAGLAVTGFSLISGEAYMIHPMLILAIVEVVYILPTVTVSAILPYKRNFKITTFGDSNKYNEKYKFMSKNKLWNSIPENGVKLYPKPIKNSEKLFEIENQKK